MNLEISEIEGDIIIIGLVRLVDLEGIGELTTSLQLASILRSVSLDNITLTILEITEADKNNITSVDPDLLSHGTTDVADTGDTIEASSLNTATTEHTGDLSIFLAFFLDNKLTINVVKSTATTALKEKKKKS
jgi:hypothetical protein